jgi:hypothetical protein
MARFPGPQSKTHATIGFGWTFSPAVQASPVEIRAKLKVDGRVWLATIYEASLHRVSLFLSSTTKTELMIASTTGTALTFCASDWWAMLLCLGLTSPLIEGQCEYI